MKRRAVRLITGWLLQSGCEDWVLDAACRLLICADTEDWQPFLVLVKTGEVVCSSWCLTPGVQFMKSASAEKRGLPHFTVPVADVLAAELFEQVEEFQLEPDDFDVDHPAPVDIVDCETL